MTADIKLKLTKLMGVNWLITIKKTIVATNTVYFFAGEKWLGRFGVREDATMYVKREAYMLEFFSYECIGSIIANVAGVARANFI